MHFSRFRIPCHDCVCIDGVCPDKDGNGVDFRLLNIMIQIVYVEVNFM